MQPTNDARLVRGPFETHADRLDLRVLLSERSEEPIPCATRPPGSPATLTHRGRYERRPGHPQRRGAALE